MNDHFLKYFIITKQIINILYQYFQLYPNDIAKISSLFSFLLLQIERKCEEKK